jgi:1-deoxy-D-xylulose-5-phosphate synthase
MEHLAEEGIATPVVRVGWPDQFIEHGSVDVLRAKHGLTPEAAVERILALLPASGARGGSGLA